MTEIRRIEHERDFRAFGELVAEYEAALPENLRLPDLDRELNDLPQRYGPPHAAFIAWVGGAAAACVGLARIDEGTALLKRLYVAPRFRKHGIARQLVSVCIAEARGRGNTRIVLDTNREQLPAAYALYESMGFAECEPYGCVDYACPTYMELTL